MTQSLVSLGTNQIAGFMIVCECDSTKEPGPKNTDNKYSYSRYILLHAQANRTLIIQLHFWRGQYSVGGGLKLIVMIMIIHETTMKQSGQVLQMIVKTTSLHVTVCFDLLGLLSESLPYGQALPGPQNTLLRC